MSWPPFLACAANLAVAAAAPMDGATRAGPPDAAPGGAVPVLILGDSYIVQQQVDLRLEQVWEVVKVLGLGVLTVGVILAALADPEPASKLALAGFSVVMITTILTSLGYDAPSSGDPQA